MSDKATAFLSALTQLTTSGQALVDENAAQATTIAALSGDDAALTAQVAKATTLVTAINAAITEYQAP